MKDIQLLLQEVQWKLKKLPLLSPRVGKVYCLFHCLSAEGWTWLIPTREGWWLWQLPLLQLRLGEAWGTPQRRTEGSCAQLLWLLQRPRGQWLRGTREKWREVAHRGRHCLLMASEGQSLRGQTWPWGGWSRGQEALLKWWRGGKAWAPRRGVRWVGAGLPEGGGRPPPSGEDAGGDGGGPARRSLPPPLAVRHTCWDERPGAPAVDRRSPGLPQSSGTLPLRLSTLGIQCSWSPWQEHGRQSSLKGGLSKVGARRDSERKDDTIMKSSHHLRSTLSFRDLRRTTILSENVASYLWL